MKGNPIRAAADDAKRQADRDATAVRISRLEDDLKFARVRAVEAEKRAHEAERVREMVFSLKAQPLSPPSWSIEQSKASDAPHIPLVFASDLQWGETIDVENMDGINAFNVAIAKERYRRLIDHSLDISLNHLPKNRYSGAIYLRGGDMVSGDIHDELRETNELSSIPAVRSLVEVETWGIQQLLREFKRVHVVSVPGNHGRTTKKPPSKRISDNYDVLSGWWLESAFRGNGKVTWQTPPSTDAVFAMHGRRYLATHGDNIGSRGGQGFVGPAATILRGMKRTMDEYARRGVTLSKMFVGHFHTAYDLGYGWSNGSLPGYSEFARANRMTPEPPLQWLIFFHPKWGATSQWKVLLEAEALPRPPHEVFPG
jgi:hypothetical protein